MNRHAMTKLKLPRRRTASYTLAVLPALLLAACSPAAQQTNATEPPLAGAAIGGPFTLIDSTGKQVRWSDFDGKYRIVYFGYTYCPDVCPFDVQKIMQGFAQFKQAKPELAAQVQPIFISVDPARDTPAKVGEFTKAFSDDLLGLTGSQEQVKEAADAFKVYFEKGETSPDGGYFVNHTNMTYLMGRKGEPIALLPTDKTPDAVADELARWIG